MFVKLNTSYLVDVSEEQIFLKYRERISKIIDGIKDKSLDGTEMLGWMSWVEKDHSMLIKEASHLRENWLKKGVDVVVIIGTGGSYIGCRAALNFCNSVFEKNNFEFIYLPSFSERYLGELLNYLKNKRFSIVVISKSGTTLESSVSFRVLRDLLFEKEGENYFEYIVAITDKSKGILRDLVNKRNIVNFVIEDDIGGRYSTLTAVGLIPMILASVDVEKVLLGAKKSKEENFKEGSSATIYASLRHYFFDEKKLTSECIASYDPQLSFTLEKMKQLFAESEGKKEKGLMPVLFNFTPDLHSVGQLLQDGFKSFFETIVLVNKPKYEIQINKSKFENDDNLDWLVGKNLKEINNCAFSGTIEAHSKTGKVNNLVIELASWDPEVFGYFYFWLSLVAMFSAYLFEVNPFDQPGVETYKKRMFELLGKP